MSGVAEENINGLLERGLDYATLRHSVLANNIANINTPRFKRSDVSFQKMMRTSMASEGGFVDALTNSRHIPFNETSGGLEGIIYQPGDTPIRNDLNNVDVNTEMAESAKNSLYYQSLVQIASRRFRLMKDVIRGR